MSYIYKAGQRYYGRRAAPNAQPGRKAGVIPKGSQRVHTAHTVVAYFMQ